MMDQKTYRPISKDIHTNDDLDFQFLKDEGIKVIQRLGSKLWTDYNTHDPGVTILEILAYAITDLGYRLSLPVEDLLLGNDKANFLKKHFHMATDVLPCKALTVLDYRMLFMDIEGIKNSWIEPYSKQVYADCKNLKMAYDPIVWQGIPQKDKTSFELKGLHKILVDASEEIPFAQIKKKVLLAYHQNRNLCEDVVEVIPVESHPVQVCAIIDLSPEADEELIAAKIEWEIEQYFSPNIHFYSFEKMLEKGYSTDEIIEGPYLKHGYLDPSELQEAALRNKISQSDIIQLIMDIEGVEGIRDLSINHCDEDATGGGWTITIPEGKKPSLCDKSKFNFYKGLLPLNVNQVTVAENKKAIVEQNLVEQYEIKEKEFPLPVPHQYPLGDFSSIRNDFPEVYGVGPLGIPENAKGMDRQKKANQLKAYLTFFDQILISYFKHITEVKNLLSVFSTHERTYFTETVTDIGDHADFLGDFYSDGFLYEDLLAPFDERNKRSQKLKDHLLARFAEKFSDYAFLMKKIYGSGVDEQVLDTKSFFLEEYGKISAQRSTAMNYYKQPLKNLWDTDNTSGFEKRVALLVGIRDYFRKNLARSFVEIFPTTNSEGEAAFKWRIYDKDKNVLLTANKFYRGRTAAHKDIYLVIQQVKAVSDETIEDAMDQFEEVPEVGFDFACFKVSISPTGRFSFSIFNLDISDPNNPDYLLASQQKYFTFQNFRNALLGFKSFMSEEMDDEGMFVVENILLRPDFNEEDIDKQYFMPFCKDDCGQGNCLDPYSFRLTIVLPGNSFRFADRDFRDFLENLIREELPAHILAKICWIGRASTGDLEQEDQMSLFEEAYANFLSGLTVGNYQYHEQFVKILSELHSIYPTGTLYNCEDEDESNAMRDTIILGRSNLGTI
ncbi:hypothetical protein [Cyclobacterium qasimii]|uniref:Uncharacterized protein n=2 Tax=Cyclobacterium qasimii TaxID=1350429 RepID=S7VMX7_9BACT|nr:hypothetical protein [Cyclobacterium qasimii]EPR71555.1 hypothetical protein ADICYQ_0223 [Cyclobacterium qasimii M12-11B]GEO20262.1 hypothetical protein CQA01_07960 [Cyclobacterium qasimii]